MALAGESSGLYSTGASRLSGVGASGLYVVDAFISTCTFSRPYQLYSIGRDVENAIYERFPLEHAYDGPMRVRIWVGIVSGLLLDT